MAKICRYCSTTLHEKVVRPGSGLPWQRDAKVFLCPKCDKIDVIAKRRQRLVRR